ncbi:hypothetical protein [Ruminiclostridium josui]|uniref:hypothetical protein n=1 Tax=Ruminiclostridium josui TaxID=1499 RepID=UPI00046702BA|nr:hypothetical protein [Ruminiclostridium josui]
MPNNLPQQEHSTQEQIIDYKNHMALWFNSRYCRSDDVRSFTFESEVWLLKKAYHNNDRERIDFSLFSKVIYNRNDKVLIKCFLANMLMDGYSEATVYAYYSILKQFYISSHGLTTVNELSDDEIKYYCSQNDKIYLYIPINFIEFIIENSFYSTNYKTLVKAKNKLNLIHNVNNKANESRELPSNKDIAMFQYYLHKFETTEQDKDLKNLFLPVIIWWRISIVIPIRPSEITYNLNKDCIFRLNNACYIRLNRIKGSLIKRMQIPIARKICISEDLYDLIKSYQDVVAYDTKSVTLFSIDFLRNCFLNVREKEDMFRDKANTFLRFYEEYTHFESTDLNQLIDLFYDFYINRQINAPKEYDRLRAGDTRHLAFSSLLLQNLNPIDIAMIGGHTSLESLGSYVNHVDLYIDSEIYRYYNNIDLNTYNYSKKLKDIIMNMPFQAPSNFEDSIPDEYGIGYCTDRSFSCEDDLCFFCSKWWCRPKNENLVKAGQYISRRSMVQLKNELSTNKKMLHALLNKASIELINGSLILKEEYYCEYRQLIKSITGNANRLEMLKEALILNFNGEGKKDE